MWRLIPRRNSMKRVIIAVCALALAALLGIHLWKYIRNTTTVQEATYGAVTVRARGINSEVDGGKVAQAGLAALILRRGYQGTFDAKMEFRVPLITPQATELTLCVAHECASASGFDINSSNPTFELLYKEAILKWAQGKTINEH